MKYLLFLIFITFIPVSESRESDEKRTPDGRMGTSCYQDQTKLPWIELCQVSVPQLVITPERYHGKKVRVMGHLIVQFEAVGLLSPAGRVWLKLSEEKFKEYQSLSGNNVLVEGEYDGLSFGHGGQWGGTIKDVTRVQKM